MLANRRARATGRCRGGDYAATADGARGPERTVACDTPAMVLVIGGVMAVRIVVAVLVGL